LVDGQQTLQAEQRAPADIGFVTESRRGIKCCEVALSSASSRNWSAKYGCQKAHDTAQRFVHRFRLSGHEEQRISQRIATLRLFWKN